MRFDTYRPRARQAAAGAVLAAAALALAACSGTSGSSSGAAVGGASLAFAIQAQPPSLDPAQLDAAGDSYIWDGIYDTLLYADANGNLSPNAATSWKYTEGATVLTLKLRSGMTFSDGAPVTSADVAATLQRDLKTPGPRSQDMTGVKSVTAPDGQTVVITLSAPNSSLLSNLAGPAGVIAETKDLGEKSIALDPVGSGPYTLDTAHTVSGSTYVLVKRQGYWDASKYPWGKVTIKVIADTQASFNALTSGQLDAGEISAQQVSAAKAAGLTIKPITGIALGEIAFLDLGKKVPALASVKVRQAINMAFDRQLYVSKLLGGGGSATDEFFNPNQGAYVPSLSGYYQYNVAQAKSLLAQAGYPNGFTVTMPSDILSQAFQPAITQSLESIGVTVNWVSVPPQDLNTITISGKFPMVFTFEGTNTPAIEYSTQLGPTGNLNPSGHTDATLQRLAEEAAAAATPQQQDAIYQQINKYAVGQALVCPLFDTTSYIATKPAVTYLPDALLQNLRAYAPAS